MRPSWHEYFMSIAKLVSTRSTCNSRPIGAVIVKDQHILATGYNGSPPGAPHCLGHFNDDGTPFCNSRYMKASEGNKFDYCRANHAEANAIAQAARLGIAVENASIYVTLSPCYVCTKLLASARIRHVYFEHEYDSANSQRDNYWKNIFAESGFITWEKITMSEKTIEQVVSALGSVTSVRKLPKHKNKENE